MAVASRWWRWSAVAAGVVVLVSLPFIVAALPAYPAAVTAEQLADRIAASAAQPYQGFVLSSGTAGLPSLPQVADVIALLNGETKLRAYYESPSRWRVDQIGIGTERDLYQTPAGLELWDFGTNQLTSIVGEPPVRLPRGADLVPPDLARRLLGTARSGTSPARVEPLPAKRVAGLAAAGLRLTPTEEYASVGHVDIWADARSGLPVQVEITGKGAAEPVLVSRFLDLSLGAPGRGVLAPPTAGPGMGHSVTSATEVFSAFASLRPVRLPPALAGLTRTTTGTAAQLGAAAYGSGFGQFLVLPVRGDIAQQTLDRADNAGGSRLFFGGGGSSGNAAGAVVTASMITVEVVMVPAARRNYLLVGLVDPALLRRAGNELATFRGGPPS